ncbi:ubiquinone-dependent pyruvate dehydrogenase, partial [Staphylococcus sp. EG-SA-29]|nr:ubiquinone-dependent pyruvate dehydrogenase [Staphylococcus sp. EG-SA-29]
QETIQELASHINRAKKVALFVGAGIEGAHDEVVSLAEKAAAPVGHSLRGKDFIQYDNPLDVGMTGLLGYGAAAEGIHDADLMIMIGTDFPYDQFLPETTTIQIDTDPSVMGRRTDVDLQIEGSALETLRALLPLVEYKKDRKWLDRVLKKHDQIMN